MSRQTGRRPVSPLEGEARLMSQAAAGDVEAFRALYERYKAPVMSYVFGLVSQRHVAEEITQEVFLRAYRARETYRADARFSTWLWTIARNSAYDHLRKKKEVLLIADPDDGDTELDRLASPMSDAESQLMEHVDRVRLERCMAGLSDPQRDALTLRTVSELSYEEIAESLGTSLASVKSLIFRAKRALLDCIKEAACDD